MLIINTPEAHWEVFHTHCYAFTKPGFMFLRVGDITGREILCAKTEEHWGQGRTLQVLFSVPNLKRIFHVVADKAETFARSADRKLDENEWMRKDSEDDNLHTGAWSC